jgi:glycosyltransferase involved in cell wall biosynthesis
MLSNIKVFVRYAWRYGWTNTVIFALFKFFPRKFILLGRKLRASNGAVSPYLSSIDYEASLESVYDYGPWTSFGGSNTPAPSVQKGDIYVWFVPDWSNVWGGGHYTLFRFAHHFSKLGVHNVIYIYNNQRHSDPSFLQNELNKTFKGCKLQVIIDPKKLPFADVAIATTWQSAFDVKAFSHVRDKFYFMQDYECQFYAYGTAAMQAASTYSFGFKGITGGAWLKSRYEAHGGQAQNYRFAADPLIFYPETPEAKVRSEVKRIFFYGRPSTERRCFELGLVALKKISQLYPDVEIVIGGLDLAQNPPFPATLMGNMTLSQTGELYRTCDVGIAFSGTNLSYLPVELMKSGVPVLSNNGPHIEWHCQHGVNSYLVDPSPNAILDGFVALYKDRSLRQKLVDGGLSTMRDLSWENEMTKIFKYIETNRTQEMRSDHLEISI